MWPCSVLLVFIIDRVEIEFLVKTFVNCFKCLFPPIMIIAFLFIKPGSDQIKHVTNNHAFRIFSGYLEDQGSMMCISGGDKARDCRICNEHVFKSKMYLTRKSSFGGLI